MMPTVRQFILRNDLPRNSGSLTGDIVKWDISFPAHWPGVVGEVRLINQSRFDWSSDGTNSHVWCYHDGTKTSFNLAGAPLEKVEAVKGLILKNKLNDKTALDLAKTYFRLQGHKEEDFHPPEFGQYGWGEKGESDYVPYPFYMARWYRRDVTREDRESGNSTLPSVMIKVSGINSNLVSYHKWAIPIGLGRDFAPEVRPWLQRKPK
jgi:hypothetical protein